MKTIILVLVAAVLVVFVLQSGVTPWRIVRVSELHSVSSPASPGRPAGTPLKATTDHSGDWMRDPNYRTSLEKTTLIGRPEPAASRDGPRKR